MDATPAVPVTGCLQLCLTIIDQLSIAKHNKQECSSLKNLIESIKDFLEGLPADGLSNAANNVMKRMAEALESSQGFLGKMTRMGPLTSLLMAREYRQHLLRFNRDLSGLFSTMASGEKLVYLHNQRLQALRSVQAELRASSALFTDKEMLADQLLDIASSAQQQNMHPEQLHKLLLDQLEVEDEISGLTPEELLNELYALQLEEMYTDDQASQTTGKPKPLGSKTEEFLVQQICAACAPKAARAGKPLTPAAATQPPAELLCPISGEIMSDPVMLCATGQTYDALNIQRWLQHSNKCPVTGQQLSSKQLSPNYVVKSLIQLWARQNGVRLREQGDSRSQVLGGSSSHSGILKSAQAAPSSSDDPVVGLDAAEQGRATAAGDKAMHGLLPTVSGGDVSGTQQQAVGKSRWRCTRTSWAIALLVLVLGGAVALGVGIPLAMKRKGPPVVNPPAAPAPISPQNPTNSNLQTQISPTPAAPTTAAPTTAAPTTAAPTTAAPTTAAPTTAAPTTAAPTTAAPTTAAPTKAVSIADTQLEALLAIKASADKNGAEKMQGWSRQSGANGGYCKWAGISDLDVNSNCSSNYLVKGLYLYSQGLLGTIPNQIADLTQLEYLDLGLNNFVGQLPETWSKLPLRILYLQDNKLSGTIPASWSALTDSLERLYLDGNQHTGPLPEWLGDCPKIISISLSLTGFKALYLLRGGSLHHLDHQKIFGWIAIRG